jgi:hypothetical protein
MMRTGTSLSLVIPITALLAAAACGDDGGGGATGTVQATFQAEETIPDGIQAGTGEENIVDGWSVTYTKYVIALGNYQFGQSADQSASFGDDRIVVADLTSIPSGGLVFATFEDVDATRWDLVSYENPNATASAEKDDSVAQEDFDALVGGGYSLRVAGSATMGDTTITFDWAVKAPTAFSNCGPETGDKGIAVVDGGTTQSEGTIHGDHFWFDSFPEGSEAVVMRRAEWLNQADLATGGDGDVTVDDLGAAAAADLFPSELYSLTGAPNSIDNGLDWVVAQAHTFGHLQGEGECEWTVE